MTYYNPVQHAGHERFASSLAEAGIDGAIVPDLPLDELDGWGDAADAAGVETVLLAAPTTPDDRLRAICERSRGFVYGVALMGVTGERAQLADQAQIMGQRCKAATDRPVLLGVGISTAEQAVEAAADADGVIVGSALVGRVLRGGGPEEAHAFVAESAKGTRLVSSRCRSTRAATCARRPASPSGSTKTTCAGSRSARSARCRWSSGARTVPSRRPRTLEHMHARLAEVVGAHFEFEHYVDDNMRNIPDHYHAHARPRGGFFGHGLKRREPGAWSPAGPPGHACVRSPRAAPSFRTSTTLLSMVTRVNGLSSRFTPGSSAPRCTMTSCG